MCLFQVCLCYVISSFNLRCNMFIQLQDITFFNCSITFMLSPAVYDISVMYKELLVPTHLGLVLTLFLLVLFNVLSNDSSTNYLITNSFFTFLSILLCNLSFQVIRFNIFYVQCVPVFMLFNCFISLPTYIIFFALSLFSLLF